MENRLSVRVLDRRADLHEQVETLVDRKFTSTAVFGHRQNLDRLLLLGQHGRAPPEQVESMEIGGSAFRRQTHLRVGPSMPSEN